MAADAPVALHDVHLSFGDLSVLDGVSLRVRAGELVAVLGPSGSGKSTVLSLVAGLLAPDAGTVGVAGRCGWMAQADLLFAWRSVGENVALGLEVQGVKRREARARARALLAELGLDGFTDARPHELSGGMRQRAALARTLLPDPDVLLLDEPFGALDALTRADLQDWLARVWAERPRPCLLVTHDVREAARLADRVLVLSHRPARVVAEIDVPSPRDLDVERSGLEASLLAALRGSP